MTDVCNICGLPKDLCVCDQISGGQRKISVTEKQAKGSKFVTVVLGIDNPKDVENLFKELKREFACGGTSKNNQIELQGRHRKKVMEYLISKGYQVDQFY